MRPAGLEPTIFRSVVRIHGSFVNELVRFPNKVIYNGVARHASAEKARGNYGGNETAWFDGVKTRRMTPIRGIFMTSTLDHKIAILLGQMLQ